jgi:transcription elongation GreA/GreB family factor
MSQAFVKETDSVEELPEKLVSEHCNLVTPERLALIRSDVDRLQDDLAEAQRASNRDAIARASRDLRYWNQRFANAEVQPLRVQKFRIVGEDEANPAKGTLS